MYLKYYIYSMLFLRSIICSFSKLTPTVKSDLLSQSNPCYYTIFYSLFLKNLLCLGELRDPDSHGF
jgi:hypothetical protein